MEEGSDDVQIMREEGGRRLYVRIEVKTAPPILPVVAVRAMDMLGF